MNNKPEGLTMADINELTAKLKAVAQKATALNLDTAQVKRGNGGYLECPCCEGAGYVEEENDFCNIDGVALGVQFYGIGPHHGLAEEYLRLANPANVLALTEALDKREELRAAANSVVTQQDIEIYELRQRIAELEAQLAELAAQEPVSVRYRWRPPYIKVKGGNAWIGEWKYCDPGVENPRNDYERQELFTRAAPPAPFVISEEAFRKGLNAMLDCLNDCNDGHQALRLALRAIEEAAGGSVSDE